VRPFENTLSNHFFSNHQNLPFQMPGLDLKKCFQTAFQIAFFKLLCMIHGESGRRLTLADAGPTYVFAPHR
jgi:hypothetical protein